MPEIAFRKTCVIENDFGLGAMLFEFKFDDRVDALVPMSGTPSLNDSLVGNQFYISSNDQSPEGGKDASRFRVDLGWHTGERCELF